MDVACPVYRCLYGHRCADGIRVRSGLLVCLPFGYHFWPMFRLSFCYVSRLGKGRHVLYFLFFLYYYYYYYYLLVSVLFIVRAMCAWSSVRIAALCSRREQCVTRGVRADVPGREVLCAIKPGCIHNPEI